LGNAWEVGSGSVGGVSGDDLATLLALKGLTFPLPDPNPESSFASLLLEVDLSAEAVEPLTAEEDKEAEEEAVVASVGGSIKATNTTTASTASTTKAAASVGKEGKEGEAVLSDEDWANVKALASMTSSSEDKAKEASPPTPSSPPRTSSSSSASARTDPTGLWRQRWTFGRRVDMRPTMRWDHDWQVCDMQGMVATSCGEALLLHAVGDTRETTEELPPSDVHTAAALSAPFLLTDYPGHPALAARALAASERAEARNFDRVRNKAAQQTEEAFTAADATTTVEAMTEKWANEQGQAPAPTEATSEEGRSGRQETPAAAVEEEGTLEPTPEATDSKGQQSALAEKNPEGASAPSDEKRPTTPLQKEKQFEEI